MKTGKIISGLALVALGFASSIALSSASEEVEQQLLESDPRRNLIGIVSACQNDDEQDFYSYYSARAKLGFSELSDERRTTYFTIMCNAFDNGASAKYFGGSLTNSPLAIMKTTEAGKSRPVYSVCVGVKNIAESCSSGLKVVLENDEMKLDI